MIFENKIALVTGGNSGIGLAIAQGLARDGARVVMLGRNAETLNKQIAESDDAYRNRLSSVIADVRNETEVAKAVDTIIAEFGRIDFLINAAGVSQRQPQSVQDIPVDEWHRIIDTNLHGTFYCCHKVLPLMRQAGSGYIINILSTGAYRAGGNNSLYSASKFGVRAMTESMIEENRRSGIRISSISPGPVNTNIWSHKIKHVTDEDRETMLKPEEIAGIALFLLSQPPNVHIDNITVTPWLR